MSTGVSFYLNGKAVHIADPAPDLLLIDYLRSPEVGLAGPKKACGQGGCGACTVILSSWKHGQAEHRAINSCLRPVCALGGLVVTTIEGTGAARRPNPEFLHHAKTSSRFAGPPDAPAPPVLLEALSKAQQKRSDVIEAVRLARASAPASLKAKLAAPLSIHPSQSSHEGMNPVAHSLALNNGTQCGYCSVGFVMNMSEFIINHSKATKKEIEDIFDGNLCRCTGYRPILTAMKTFASNWTELDERHRMKCLEDDGCAAQRPADIVIPFPPSAREPAEPVDASGAGQEWRTPLTLAELASLMHENRRKKIRLVHGNTSYGIYKDEFPETFLFLDIRLIPEFQTRCTVEKDGLHVGAGTSYSDLITVLDAEMKARDLPATSRWGACQFMARRTAGRIVRNAASLGGNTMLVLKHIAPKKCEPFPSDLFTALIAVEARIEYLELNAKGTFDKKISPAQELIDRMLPPHADSADNIILITYVLPKGQKDEVVLPQKVAQRDVNAHSIVNSTSLLRFSKGSAIEKASLVFGGIAPYPWHAKATESALLGKRIGLELIPQLTQRLEEEVRAELKKWAPRLAGLPSEGFTDDYRVQLTVSFFYKAIINAMLERGVPVPPPLESSGLITWGNWPVSDGRQFYAKQAFKKPVAQPYIKITAMYQTSGQLHYTQELPVPPLTLNAAFIQSRRALANYHFVIPDRTKEVSAAELREHLRKFPSFVDLITCEQIRAGGVNYQGMGYDQPLFAEKMVNFIGQSIALVLATTEQEAIRIAEYATRSCVGYSAVDWKSPWHEPVLGLEQAIRLNSVFPDAPQAASYVSHIWKITRPGSEFGWARPKDPLDREIVVREGPVDGLKCRIVENTQINGGQAHFYMETQACLVEPQDERRFTVHPSSQSPMEMHQTAAMALGVNYHDIDVQVAPVGGAFGGKTEQARFVTGPVAVAAQSTKRPVRLAMPRDEDTLMIGKRHAYYGQYQIAVDLGEVRPKDKGIIRGWQTRMWGDGGAFYDCSFIVSNCIQLRADNAYRVRNFENQIDVCRTNTAPNTAFRSFGDVQGKNIIENAVDDAAFTVGMLPEDLREKNFYDRGDVTPFGQALSYCYIREVWSYLKNVSHYSHKRAEVDEFNRKNKWRKRGLAMLPVKYGSGYNLKQLEQAAAIVAVNQADGSVVIHQGGVEMGQGLATQVLQVAAYVLNIPMEMIFVEGAKTSITPNPTSSGASTGTPYNCEAVKQTCQELRSRLMEFGYETLKEQGGVWCTKNGIDFWNHGEAGWSAKTADRKTLIWQKLIALAYTKRVNLIATYTAKIQGGGTPVPAMTFKPQELQPDLPGIKRDKKAVLGGGVDSFTGFTYSAACSVVEVDILTGEVKLLSSDIVYDMGWSLNPAIDIGQVEGAFIQGVGYLLTENLVFQEDGPERGRLNTTNTWRYKPPASTTIPLEMNVHLFPRNLKSVAGIPEDPHDIFSAKEVGEPPLVLANSVFFAIKAAIRASRLERKLNGLFRFDAPATVQEVRRACEISTGDLR